MNKKQQGLRLRPETHCGRNCQKLNAHDKSPRTDFTHKNPIGNEKDLLCIFTCLSVNQAIGMRQVVCSTTKGSNVSICHNCDGSGDSRPLLLLRFGATEKRRCEEPAPGPLVMLMSSFLEMPAPLPRHIVGLFKLLFFSVLSVISRRWPLLFSTSSL